MNEATLSTALVKTLRTELPGSVVFKHSDKVTSGIPDITVTWNGRTTWIEVKFANPKVVDTGVQALTMKRLANAGSAMYVIYSPGQIGTRLVHPGSLHYWEAQYTTAALGFNHKAVAEWVRAAHGGGSL